MNRTQTVLLPTLLLALAAAPSASAGLRLLITDRTADTVWLLRDLNNNGGLDDAGEVTVFFSGANAAGTQAPANFTTLACRKDGFVVVGDQGNRTVTFLKDLNGDDDAQDPGESIVAANASNLSGISFAFPTGAEFDASGNIYVVNAGNASGADGIYRLTDGNGDRDCMDAGEITQWVGDGLGGFGPGNGAYSPQEVCFSGGRGFVHNSSAGLFGVFAFEDTSLNGRADDVGEFYPVFDATNASGIPPVAGFPIEPDRARPGSLYIEQTASGPTNQFVRLSPITLDGDYNDAAEAVIVYSTAEGGITPIDLLSLSTGELLFTDATALRIIKLTDLDNDNKFTSAGERTTIFANTLGTILACRQIAAYPIFCPSDFNGDRSIGTADLTFLLGNFGQSVPPYTGGDSNGDGQVGTADLTALLGAFGTICP